MPNALSSALLAGTGGLVPMLLKYGAALVADPAQDLPGWHSLIGMAAFFILAVL
jgi:hypothetical protein